MLGDFKDCGMSDVARAAKYALANCILDWKSLHGKTLDVSVGVDVADGRECVVVMGHDKKSGKYYMIHESTEEVKL